MFVVTGATCMAQPGIRYYPAVGTSISLVDSSGAPVIFCKCFLWSDTTGINGGCTPANESWLFRYTPLDSAFNPIKGLKKSLESATRPQNCEYLISDPKVPVNFGIDSTEIKIPFQQFHNYFIQIVHSSDTMRITFLNVPLDSDRWYKFKPIKFRSGNFLVDLQNAAKPVAGSSTVDLDFDQVAVEQIKTVPPVKRPKDRKKN